MRKLTHDEQAAEIAAKNPNVEIIGKITRGKDKVLTRCRTCGHEWGARPSDLKHGHGCPECKKVKLSNAKRLTRAEHIAAIAKVNPNVEVLGKIMNNQTKVLCRCKICGYEWEAIPHDLKHRHGCPECGKIKKADKLRLTHAEQVAAIAKINPDVEVLGEITGNNKKVLCRCKVCCHKWETLPATLKNRHGCPECAQIKRVNAATNTTRKTHAEHVADIVKANQNVEVLGEIINANTKVLCRCKVCGHEWGAQPANLKSGEGCPRCAKYGFHSHDVGKLYIMVDDLNVPTMMKIGVSVNEKDRSKAVLNSARRAGVTIPALYVAKTWEGPTDLMQRIENMMHENYAEWNIKFPAKFDGCTEFFYYTPETAEAFDIIEETYHEIINASQAA